MAFHSIYIDSYGILKGSEISCKKCTVSFRCDQCDSLEYIDYDNFEYNDDGDLIEEDFVIEDSTYNIDTVLIDTDKSDSVKMVEPGFVGWVNYGGTYRPAKVISRNKQRKSAFVIFF